MDANTLLIVNKIQKNEPIEFRDLILYLIVIPVMTLVLSKFSIVYTVIYDYLLLKYKQWSDFNEILIEGYETINYISGIQYEYPPVLTAFVWKISKDKHKIDLRAYNNKWMKNLSPTITSSMEFSLDTTRSNWISLEDDISFTLLFTQNGTSKCQPMFELTGIKSLLGLIPGR